MLTFRFTGATGRMVEKEALVSGMVGKQIRFEFSEEWNGLAKTAVYRAGETVCTTENLQETDVIPRQVLKKALRRLYVGVCGMGEDGALVIPTVFVPGPFIQIGSGQSDTPEWEPEDPDWKRFLEEAVRYTPQNLTQEQKAQARANIGAAEGSGLSARSASLLMEILRKAVYTEDVSLSLLELEDALGGGETPEVPETVWYSVSCGLEHVTAQPASAMVEQGKSCAVTLMPEEGYVLETVTVTMGGTDITATSYADGTVTVAAVTGNVVITAKAAAVPEEPEDSGGILFVPAYVSQNQLCKWGYPAPRMTVVTKEPTADTPVPQDVDMGLGDLYLLPVPAGVNLLKVTCPGLVGGPQFLNLEDGAYTTPLDVGYLSEGGFEYAFDADTYDFIAINFKKADGSHFFIEGYDTSEVSFSFETVRQEEPDDPGDEEPEEPEEPEVTQVPITLSLTQTSVSNNQRTIGMGEQYVAAFVPAEGYYLNSVKVTMGGADVTAQVYSNGIINIPSVTGDILVLAVSVAEPGPVVISEIGRGTTSYAEGVGLMVNRNPDMGGRATVIPVGQYLKKGTTYRFSLGNAGSDYSFGVQIMVASAPGLTFDTPIEQDVRYASVIGREVDTGWLQSDYTYTPAEHNRIFTMNFKRGGGSFEEAHYAQLLANVVIEEVTA